MFLIGGVKFLKFCQGNILSKTPFHFEVLESMGDTVLDGEGEKSSFAIQRSNQAVLLDSELKADGTSAFDDDSSEPFRVQLELQCVQKFWSGCLNVVIYELFGVKFSVIIYFFKIAFENGLWRNFENRSWTENHTPKTSKMVKFRRQTKNCERTVRRQERRAERKFDPENIDFDPALIEVKMAKYKERHARRVQERVIEFENELDGNFVNSTHKFKLKERVQKRFESDSYATFFKDLKITKEGIFPLESKPMMVKPDYLEWASADDTDLPMPLEWFDDSENQVLTHAKYVQKVWKNGF